jgi:hypothetical protein
MVKTSEGWAHFEFTRINTAPTFLCKKIEDFREAGPSMSIPNHASRRIRIGSACAARAAGTSAASTATPSTIATTLERVPGSEAETPYSMFESTRAGTTEWLMGPALSHDGTRVVYARVESGSSACTLWMSGVAGGTPIRLTNDNSIEFPGSSSDD